METRYEYQWTYYSTVAKAWLMTANWFTEIPEERLKFGKDYAKFIPSKRVVKD